MVDRDACGVSLFCSGLVQGTGRAGSALGKASYMSEPQGGP